MRTRETLAVVLMVLAGGCNLIHPQQTEEEKRNEQIKATAAAYLQDHYPNWLKDQAGVPIVHDNGDTWVYTYKLPPETYGAPVVLLDKTSLQVIRAYHTQ